MRIKNVEIEGFIVFLMDLELKGKQSRLRTRFVKNLLERQKLVDEEHKELIKQYATIEDGEPKIIEENGIKMYDIQDRESFNKEYSILLNENYIIDENEERKEMLLSIKESILDCDKMFKGKEALEYDRWCEIVEQINYEL